MTQPIKDQASHQKKKTVKDVRAWMRITQEDKERLEEVANHYHLTPSQYLRMVLKDALHQELTINPKNI